MTAKAGRIVLIHADESCLGNGRDGRSPGGAASLVETPHGKGVARRDLYLCSPDTTNNQMALRGAIETLSELSEKGGRLRIFYVSDSQYLVKGMNEWVAAWRRRGWRRKGGVIENLQLWRELVTLDDRLAVKWEWVRGHSGHPKNEYVDELAVRAASEQLNSDGFIESGWGTWLAHKQASGEFINYDPDERLMHLKIEAASKR